MKERCPECKIRFSDWFVWDGYCFCFPCVLQNKTGMYDKEKAIFEKSYYRKKEPAK